MRPEIVYTSSERLFLWMLGAFGVTVLNGVFIYTLIMQPTTLLATFDNPIAATFIVESFLLLGALAYLLRKWQVSRLHWGWFVLLSLLGSIAFAMPVVLLWRQGETTRPGESVALV